MMPRERPQRKSEFTECQLHTWAPALFCLMLMMNIWPEKKISVERLLPTLNHTASKWWGQKLNVHPEFLFLRFTASWLLEQWEHSIRGREQISDKNTPKGSCCPNHKSPPKFWEINLQFSHLFLWWEDNLFPPKPYKPVLSNQIFCDEENVPSSCCLTW